MGFIRIANKIGLKSLHMLEPEAAHEATIRLLKTGLSMPCSPVSDGRLSFQLGDLFFANPLGMAAGFDKNGEVPDALLKMGFGFAEAGTVTPVPQEGNPKPRNFRLTADEAVINRYGFNNDGHEVVYNRLKRRARNGGVVGINIGANKTTEDKAADYAAGVHRFADIASYFTVNISSPNTPGLRALQERDALSDLLKRSLTARDEEAEKLGRRVPVFLKIAPDMGDAQLKDIAEEVLALKIDGLIVSNTTVDRPRLKDAKQAGEAGGLSGKPLFRKSTIALAKMRRLVGPDLPIIGVGGIDGGPAAWTKITAGANLLQLYTSMVFKGPDVIKDINRFLLQQIEKEGLTNLQQAVGSNVDAWADLSLSE
ncbi:quinone-dependent dihydroorotate dehydrogenase [Pseudovibrio sp. SPO723]|uniref:quinone-dependent dihydroorotate dehydrogenase n=1 Tax=Nesiotobacter zosterae TaxID=392721 RepID=UPI0029C36A9B|nr:quinone-dependent dihydroorotate dehydrogenase [Pseudovibrio sp. SPO723]MDX5593177.1 quinone-dependent dihydroorotate dehydrogenase [Pseudovibrio sp. SPO723]